MATDGSPFVKIEPDRLGLSDCAAEIRNNVYKEYFRGGKLRIFPLLVGDRVTSKDEEAEYYSRGEDSIEHSHATILLCSKKVYHEALPFLYNDKVFEIVDKVVQDKVGKQIVFGTSSMPSLPQTILSNIKSLSVDITSFGYGLARLNDARTVRPAGGYITLGTWEVATSNMPKLEVLIIQCHDWLEPRNLALRFITNVRFLSSETEISFEMSVHEHKHEPGRNQTLAPWAGTDCREDRWSQNYHCSRCEEVGDRWLDHSGRARESGEDNVRRPMLPRLSTYRRHPFLQQGKIRDW